MFNNPIYESAFKQLDLLYEQDFNLNKDSVDDIKDFMEEDDVKDAVDVIDLDADEEEDLEDSNVGKIILQCPCCETIVCKKADEIELPEECEDDEDCMVQVGDQCPVCFCEEGYRIIGKVAPYEEVEVEIEPKEDDEDDKAEDDEDADESKDDNWEDEMETDFDDSESETDSEEEDKEDDEKKNESLIEGISEFKKGKKYKITYYDENGDEKTEVVTCVNETGKNAGFPDFKFEDGTVDSLSYDQENLKDIEEVDESLTEGLNDINLETDHDKITIHAEEKAENGEEMIAPLDFQAANEIVDNQVSDEEADDYLDNLETDETVEETPAEEPVERAISTEGDLVDTAETDVDIENVDEDALDGLGESYFKQVYDNVKSYMTESIHEKGDKLIVEGIITFESGNQRRTQFVLEGNQLDSEGKCTILAENLQITPGKNAFTISGNLTNGNFIAESLSYNYKAGSTRVKGTININE